MSATFPHLSSLSASYNNAQSLEALIASARADPSSPSHRDLARRRRSSVASRTEAQENRQYLNGFSRDEPEVDVDGVGDENTLLLEEETEEDLNRERQRLLGSTRPVSRRQSAPAPRSRRTPKLSAIADDREASPSISDSSRRSRSRSISRARLASAVASGVVPGFSQADLSLAAETNTGAAVGRALHPDAARPTGFDYTLGDGGLVLGSPMIGKMTLDPAEELDPVLDLGCPADENGVVLEDWRSAMKSEMPILLWTAFPIFISQLAEYSLVLASVISIGHLGTTDLAACSLGSMTASVTCFSIMQGLASALDTLLPAAWSSEDPTRVGLWTQRMFVVMIVACIPMYMIWFNAEGFLLGLRQEPEVAARAALYLRALSIGIPGYGINTIMKKYFQAQNLMSAPTIVISIVAPLNAFLNWLLVWGPEPVRLGFVGAPLATGIGFNTAALISIIYAAFFAPKTAWGGLQVRESFKKLGTVTSLGLAGTIQISSEWWAWEACALAASLLGPVVLATQSILLSCGSVLYQVPASLGVAAAVRVGNLLGAGRPYEACWGSRTSILLCVILSLVNSAIVLVFRKQLALLFNNDPEVIAMVSSVAIYVALFQVADGLCGTTGGVLRAVGKQSAGALINLTSYYILGLPLGFWLCFKLGWGLVGIWTGLTTSLFVASAMAVWIIWRVDWVVAVDKARARLGLGHLDLEDKPEGEEAGYGTMTA